MKTIRFASMFAILIALAALFLAPLVAADPINTGPALSADPAAVVPVISPVDQNPILSAFLEQAIGHPWFATLLAFVALMRLWAKPLSTVVHLIVDLTPTDRDNGALNAIMRWFANTDSGRLLAWLIDWVTSIKIIPPAVAVMCLFMLPSCSFTLGADGSKSATLDGPGLARVLAEK